MPDAAWAKVVGVHPESHSVDVVLLSSGARIPSVPVLSPSVSSDSGHVDLPDATPPAQAYDPQDTGGREVYAAVIFFGQTPAVVGFKVPEACQMTFKDKGRRIQRHSSDVYTSTSSDGSFEVFHPSGTYLRIAESTAHEDLTGKDFDGRWKIAQNTDKQVHVHVACVAAGAVKASLDLAPTGDIAVVATGALTATVTGAATLTAASTTINGPVTINGNLHVTGTITGDTDVKTGSVSLKSHVHGGVQTGGGNTAGPH